MTAKLFLALVLIGVIGYLGWYTTPAWRKRALRSILLYGAGIFVLVLVLTGRLPWLFALICAALPWLNRALAAKRAWRIFGKFRKPEADSRRRGPTPGGSMDVAEAYEVLGLAPGAGRQEIIEAYRKLMHKIHPDRGGSDYLAARINQAREVLLDALQRP